MDNYAEVVIHEKIGDVLPRVLEIVEIELTETN
jgi:hypothetical protein